MSTKNSLKELPKILYDEDCCFCRSSIQLLKSLDWCKRLEYAPGRQGITEMRLELPDGRTLGGFWAFRRLVWLVPPLYPMILLVYLPGSGILGPKIYRWVARHRHSFPGFRPKTQAWCRR